MINRDAERFRYIRKSWGLDLKQMADLLGVTVRTIRNYENETRRINKTVWLLIEKIQKLKQEKEKVEFFSHEQCPWMGNKE